MASDPRVTFRCWDRPLSSCNRPGVSVEVVAVTIFVALLCVCILIGHLLEENRWANDKWHSSHFLSFDEELFFIYLLPPIIFNAVKKKQFFRNFSIIFLLGAVGTLISFCFISAGSYFLFKMIGVTSFGIQQYLAIGAIFSATDSVCTLQVLNQDETPLLYSVVFGEGVVNDATSIVLFNAVQKLDFNNFDAVSALKLLGTFLYLFFTSTALGVAAGLLCAYITKKLYFARHSTNREVAMMLLMAYLSYMLAQLCSLSGILSIFFCGVVMSHYTWHNVTERSRITTRRTFIFLYVGMDALDIDKWKQSNGSVRTTVTVSGILLALIMLGRAAFVFPLANLANFFRSNAKIDFSQQFIIWWSGLIRGAVTIALSYEQFSTSSSTSSDDAFLITNSIIVVLFSTMVFGSVTNPLIQVTLFRQSRPAPAADMDPPSLEDIRLLFLEPANRGVDEGGSNQRRSGVGLIIRHPTSAAHYFWRWFDDRFMRPIFGGRGFMRLIHGFPPHEETENV
ncbi:unnamed protein product [Spirodela intermedia]|uniref:Cation/H+ exchanger transmembrane domain-containing protein n=1 Tax=Spirodela intermedia TaxID=51605 RepID=A0A7I8J2L0_SPIIN|nr:unnamed protein product [Spirodela intermedia]CAA6663560.1 unnamed protein product [Spirodela intermedia]